MMHGDDYDAIHHTRVAQPALVARQLALADLWKSWGVTASVVMGHSLGDMAAAINAGVMDLASGLTLVAHRAYLMASAPHGARLAVTAWLARVTAWLAGTSIDVAAINGPESIAVSGAHDAIDALTAQLHAEGGTARPLVVLGPDCTLVTIVTAAGLLPGGGGPPAPSSSAAPATAPACSAPSMRSTPKASSSHGARCWRIRARCAARPRPIGLRRPAATPRRSGVRSPSSCSLGGRTTRGPSSPPRTPERWGTA